MRNAARLGEGPAGEYCSLPRRCHEDREVAKVAKKPTLFFFVLIVGFVPFVMSGVIASHW